jgi:hypothetical protein
MGELLDRVKLNLKVHGSDIVDNFKDNSLYFYDKYQKSTKEVESIPVANIVPGGFYFLHYLDNSNWMKYAPVFVADYKKFSNKIVIFAVNFNFIPLEVRVLLFDKFITEKDFDNNNYLKVDYQGVYDELIKLGFEYSLMEFDASLLKIVHRIELELLPRFLYSQHPINKYDPNKLMQIWEAKIDSRDQRHKEIMSSLISDFYDINSEISEKYDVLKGHIQRIRSNQIKFANKK